MQQQNQKWEKAIAARMTLIVPGLFLRNVEASHKRDMLRANCINAIVSLSNFRE